MSLRRPEKELQIDHWVRETLERRAENVDVPALVAKVHARMNATASAIAVSASTGHRARRISMTWRAVAAAAVLAGIVCLLPVSSEPASAETLVQQALQEATRRPQDRCYVIDTDWTGSPDKELLVQIPNHSLLWTRGDRFVLELSIPKKAGKSKEPNQVVRFGRDERGRIWFAATPQNGFRFEPKELVALLVWGERIKATGELYSIDSKVLLRDFLDNYKLQREPAKAGSQVQVVDAIDSASEARKPSLIIKKARLEFDPDSNMLRRVTLQRKSNKITFTLKEVSASVKADDFYHLESYLNADGRRRLQSQGPLILRIKNLIDSLGKDQ